MLLNPAFAKNLLMKVLYVGLSSKMIIFVMYSLPLGWTTLKNKCPNS